MTRYIIYSLLSTIIAGSMLVLTNKILYAIMTFLVFIIFFILINKLFIKKYEKYIIEQNDLYNFIHDFTIGYYHNNSIDEALSFSTLHVSYKLVEQVNLLNEYQSQEKLEKLNSYFNNQLYDLFYHAVIDSENKIESINRINNINNKNLIRIEDRKQHQKRSIIKYILLWLLAFIVAILLKLTISNQITNSNTTIYLVGIILFYLIFLVSNYLFITNYYRDKL